MPKFINQYECPECGEYWESVSEGAHDDKCPGCGLGISPYETRDFPTLTCDTCREPECPVRGDIYNANGDCLAKK